MENQEEYNCYICKGMTEDYMVCDRCHEHYCEDCSYTYSLHFQYQGSLCYECSGQDRITPLLKEEVRENVIDIIIKE